MGDFIAWGSAEHVRDAGKRAGSAVEYGPGPTRSLVENVDGLVQIAGWGSRESDGVPQFGYFP